MQLRWVGRIRRAAAAVGGAAAIGAAFSCATSPREPSVHGAPAPSSEERYCAWFADAREGVLYYGEAPFWSAYRGQGGDPRADLRQSGPQLIGRFDLRRRAHLPPLDLAPSASAGGVWDVLAHPNGRVYFSDFFGASGYVEPETGRVVRFDVLGSGLNEIALGPDGHLLVTRYGTERGANGSLLVIDADGALLAEHALGGGEGYGVAPKSVAWDPLRREIWLNTDLIPIDAAAGPVRHDARLLAADGRELLRFETPELQFVTFSEDGTGWFAEVDGRFLRLRVRSPERAALPILTGLVVPLDDAFAAGADFVQDLQVAGDSVVVTRWSGRIHVVDRAGRIRDVTLPADGAGSLYYTAVRAGDEVCATRCSEVEVVCAGLGD